MVVALVRTSLKVQWLLDARRGLRAAMLLRAVLCLPSLAYEWSRLPGFGISKVVLIRFGWQMGRLMHLSWFFRVLDAASALSLTLSLFVMVCLLVYYPLKRQASLS